MAVSKRNVHFVLMAATVSVFVVLFQFFGLFTWIDHKVYDSRMKKTAGFFSPSDQIAVVLLDQDSLTWARREKGWGWPWPREAYGAMVDFFNRAGASSVAFDMLFTEPSVYGTADDESFAAACRRYGKVIQTVYYDPQTPDRPLLPIEPLASSAAVIGNITSSVDADGVIRRSRFYAPSSSAEPCLALASLMVSGEKPDQSLIPAARGGGMYVRYLDDLTRYVPYSAAQILQSEYALESGSGTAGRELLDPEQFAGMHVFFGLYTPGLFDICTSPVSSVYPGVGVHISQLDTILQNQYLQDVPLWVTLLLIFLGTGAGSVLGFSRNQVRIRMFITNTALFFVIGAAYIGALYVFFAKGLILPFGGPFFSFIGSFAAAVGLSYLTEGKQRRYLKTAFRQYLSPAVIDELIRNPSLLRLGGEEREITAFFSDIQGFTSISEKLSPKELTDLLNRYLSEMTDIILSYGGTIDKYEGDAIIAFWNAPLFQKDHACRALSAAVACQQRLEQLRPELLPVSGKPVYQRIGLHTGRAVVGNMGSKNRFDYTMIGDTVNLASRLEGINKQFGTYTLCSEATMTSAAEHGCRFKFREIADIAVVGRKEAVCVFEPMTFEQFRNEQPVVAVFNQARGLFLNGDFEAASRLFSRISAADPVAASYNKKCSEYRVQPPENWNGIWVATQK